MNNGEQIVKTLVATGKWSESAARRGVRAKFKCEYCDRDLLASVDDYKEWQEDHIVPFSDGRKDAEENIAIACRTCNFNVKTKWNPQSVCGPKASREALIQATRDYIARRRSQFLADVSLFRNIVYSNALSS